MSTQSVAAPRATTGRDDFAELSRKVREGGLMVRRRGYYTVKIGATVVALLALGATALLLGNTWWNLCVAVGMAFVLAQLGFIGHDAGHRQICVRRRDNDLIGLVVANLFTGFSFGWWLTKHNRHHAHTNRPEKDPDMAPGALVYTDEQAPTAGKVRSSVRQRPSGPARPPPVPRGAQHARGQRRGPGPPPGPGGPWSRPGCSPSTSASSSWRRSSCSRRSGRWCSSWSPSPCSASTSV